MSTSGSALVNGARQKDTLTTNGALTNSTSLNSVVDMFFLAGASRNMSENDIIRVFTAALAEDKTLAYKCLFWARDIRGGAGERRFFQIIIKHMMNNYPGDLEKLYKLIPEYGYWKEFFSMFTPTASSLEWMTERLSQKDGLFAKWMPRKGVWFNALRKHMKTTPKALRQEIVSLSTTVEQKMCAKDWGSINYSHVPSIAFNLYKKAFERHDATRFTTFLGAAVQGEAKVNAGAIFPYQLYQSFKNRDNANSIIAQWNNLPDYVGEGSFLPVCDVSGSMMGLPMEISVSLGVYLSQRNKSIFKDAFVTFSTSPKMEYLKGDVVERFRQLERAHWEMSTDLQAAFRMILNAAIRNSVPQEDMPKTLLIISDMEFNSAVRGNTNYEAIEQQYAAAGYTMPKIVFWNVNGRIGNVPVSASQKDVALVSGASPAIVQSVLGGKDFTPRGIMLEALMSDRYKAVEV